MQRLYYSVHPVTTGNVKKDTDMLNRQAKEAGSFLGSILRTHHGAGKKLAFLAGGETVVQLTGHGKGVRNQELALAAAPALDRHSPLEFIGI